jgi:RND family efflux transporter MFP subunit
VAKPIVRDVTQWDEYTGRLEAKETVDVKAQVSGFVDSVDFTEGAFVKKGDLLLTIDSRIFKAQLDTAKASVEEAKAKVQLAEAGRQLADDDLKRAESMSKSGVVGEEELDTRRAALAQAQATIAENQASVLAANAAVEAAQLNVDWCRVTAPISGRISNKFINQGNMLTGGAGQTTTITTIRSIDPIYCYVDADEASVLKYQKLAREHARVSAESQPIPCYIELANEEGFPHAGTIDFTWTPLRAHAAPAARFPILTATSFRDISPASAWKDNPTKTPSWSSTMPSAWIRIESISLSYIPITRLNAAL